MTLNITWAQALAWRMHRQLLDPVGRLPVEGVVARLSGVQAQVASSAELAIRVRQRTSAPGEVGRALAEGRLIKTWAMRGTLHLLTPDEGGAVLSLMAAGRTWERPSWQRYFGMPLAAWDVFRPAVREALDGGALSREELVARVVSQPGLGHLGEALGAGWGTLLKPLAWQGDLCFGPSRGTRVTFMRPEAASAAWAGIPDPEEAAPRVIVAYLRAYGPATIDNFHNWLARGWVGARRVRGWFTELGDAISPVEVDGERRMVLTEDLHEVAAVGPTSAVRLVPGFDQYILGPGTDEAHVLAPARRTAVSKQSGWIAPMVIAGGVVSGTWELTDDEVRVTWFTEAGKPPRSAIEAEVERLAGILDRPLRATLDLR